MVLPEAVHKVVMLADPGGRGYLYTDVNDWQKAVVDTHTP